MLKFAQRVNSMKGSAARAMLNITRKPGVISFAGGLPAPELFPVEEYAKVAQSVIQDNGSDACSMGLPWAISLFVQKLQNVCKNQGFRQGWKKLW